MIRAAVRPTNGCTRRSLRPSSYAHVYHRTDPRFPRIAVRLCQLRSEIVRLYTFRNGKIVRVRNYYDTDSYVRAVRGEP